MKVLVCGGRDFQDQRAVFNALDALHAEMPITRLIHGAARGADRLAGQWADARGVTVCAYPANWRRYGRGAGPIRNARMLEVERPQLVVVFPGGHGTRHMLRLARETHTPILQIEPRRKPVLP